MSRGFFSRLLVRLDENHPERPSERAIAITNDTYIQVFIIFQTREVSSLPPVELAYHYSPETSKLYRMVIY